MGKRIYLSILSLVTVACIIAGVLWNIGGYTGIFRGSGRETNGNADQTTGNTAFTRIDIDVTSMDVTVKTGDGFHVSWTCPEKLVPECRADGTTLTVRQRGYTRDSWLHLGSTTSELTVTVPKGTVLEKLTVSSDAGNLTLSGLNTADTELTTAAGNITAEGSALGQADVHSAAGNITITSCTSAELLTVQSNAGNVKITSCTFENLTAKSNAGNATLRSDTDLSAYGMRLSTDLGDVSCNGLSGKDKSYEAAGTNGFMISLEGNLGNVSVNW